MQSFWYRKKNVHFVHSFSFPSTFICFTSMLGKGKWKIFFAHHTICLFVLNYCQVIQIIPHFDYLIFAPFCFSRSLMSCGKVLFSISLKFTSSPSQFICFLFVVQQMFSTLFRSICVCFIFRFFFDLVAVSIYLVTTNIQMKFICNHITSALRHFTGIVVDFIRCI